MTFRKFDAGVNHQGPRHKRSDCTVRALATACSMPYGDAWATLYVLQGELRMCHFPLVEALDAETPRIGIVRKLSFPAKKGAPRMTAGAFCVKHPKGRYILRMAGHVAAVKDGVLYDTNDCSHSCVYTAWEVLERTQVSTSLT